MTSLKQVEAYCEALREALNKLAKQIGQIQIGSAEQFPDGWGKAAKGRTVWRIVEEAINQNLKKEGAALRLDEVCPSDEEVSIFDVALRFEDDEQRIHLNFKTAVAGSESKKGDISKAQSVALFFKQDISRQLFIATFGIAFGDDMTITIQDCLVTPVAWLPDIYVNPSNNGNLQCSQPKTLEEATRRTNAEFVTALKAAMKSAAGKRAAKSRKAKAGKRTASGGKGR